MLSSGGSQISFLAVRTRGLVTRFFRGYASRKEVCLADQKKELRSFRAELRLYCYKQLGYLARMPLVDEQLERESGRYNQSPRFCIKKFWKH